MILRTAAQFEPSGERGIVLSKQIRFHSLSSQLFCGVLLSLVTAVLVFLFCFILGNHVLAQTVYGRPFMRSMADKQFSNLQAYVREEQVTVKNLRPLDAWCSRGDKVYLAIYLGEQILYESHMTSEAEFDPAEFNPSFENPDHEYSLTFSDGTMTKAFLYYYAGDAYYYWTIFLSVLVSFLAFSLCFIIFVHRKLRYIKHLKSELDILAGGDLSYQVTVRSGDELGELAAGIDQMRRSIVAHQAAEEKMRSANSELVTAMSHDLRTPMTSLLVYLELMDHGKYESEEQLRHFISRSLEKTLRIKAMADKLFEYFLVYSSEWDQPDKERVDADGLFQQIWGECAFSLESNGFQIVGSFGELKGCLHVNIDLLRRAFENLYSNILKYADIAEPVELSYRQVGSEVHLALTNRISAQRDEKVSSNIGLNTCSRIIQYHGGTFSTWEEAGHFNVTITLPLEE